jgi:1-deoxy-D-xylulose-5-phosphate reductoisomerase
MTPRRVTVLGSTGSVGAATLDLLHRSGVEVEITALVAGRNVEALAEQARRWRPKIAVIADDRGLEALRSALHGAGVEVAAGQDAVVEAAGRPADWIMAAIVGIAGLRPTLAAARTGAVMGIANKESIVCTGRLLLHAVAEAGAHLIPVDSEHSAIFQALGGLDASRASKLVLTSSGGPFRGWSRQQMSAVTLEQATRHPNFSMGPKITVDSAQMMNKGLEIIEAAYLFDTPPERIEVLVHPQQIIHSMVEFRDGSTMAQLSPPDMKGPIACAYAWPDRLAWPAPPLDLARLGSLTFEAPDEERFPALGLAREAFRIGGMAPAALNAANEAAVAAFLHRRIGFLDIAAAVADTLESLQRSGELTGEGGLEGALETDRRARMVAEAIILPSARRN